MENENCPDDIVLDLVEHLNRNPNIGIESNVEDEFCLAVDAARKTVGAEKYALWMVYPDGKLRVEESYNLTEKWKTLALDIGESISGLAVSEKKVISKRDITIADEDGPARKFDKTDPEVRAALVVPLICGDIAYGTFNAYMAEPHTWTEDQKKTMRKIAGVTAHAITLADRNERMKNHIADATHQVVSALVKAFHGKSSWTYEHQERCYYEAIRLGIKMEFSQKDKSTIAYGMRLHDLGKFEVSESTLNRKGRLTEQEWENMHMHPIIGVEIIKHIPYLDHITSVIGSHHERIDGSGYPKGLSGSDLDKFARMAGVLDSADAMRHARPYKIPAPWPVVVDELCRCTKLKYDAARLSLFKTVQKIVQSELTPESTKEKIVWNKGNDEIWTVDDISRLCDDADISSLIKSNEVQCSEPEHEQYDPKIVGAYVETLKDRKLISEN